MEEQRSESLRVWAWRMSAAAAVLVGILSLTNGIDFFWLMLRTLLTFVIMYGLSAGSVFLFFQGAPERLDEKAKGNLLDIVVGGETAATDWQEDNVVLSAPEGGVDGMMGGTGFSGLKAPGFPGQVEPGLAQGLPDMEQQAQIVRRMGWND